MSVIEIFHCNGHLLLIGVLYQSMDSCSIATSFLTIIIFSLFDIWPVGFEDVIQVHFAIQREAIMKQLSQWVKEVISPEHERKLRKAIDEFRAEMDKL